MSRLGVTEWCRQALRDAKGDVQEVYARYTEFREATGSVASEGTFQRRVREASTHARGDSMQAEAISHSGDGAIVAEEDVNTRDVRSEQSYDIRTVDDLVAAADIDTRVWHIYGGTTKSWPVFMKMKAADERGKIKSWVEKRTAFYVSLNLDRIEPVETKWPVVKPIALPKPPKAKREKPASGLRRALLIMDSQNGYVRNEQTGYLDPLHDRQCWDLAVQAAERTRPHLIVIGGDMLDMSDWSGKFVVTPDLMRVVQPALLELGWWLYRLREAAPQAKIVYLEGNHEKRMLTSILTNTLAAYGLRSVSNMDGHPQASIPAYLDLAALGIEWIGGYPDSHYWLNPRTRLSHGDVSSIEKLLKDATYSEVVGHLHRNRFLQKTIHGHDGIRSITAMGVGTMARVDGIVPSGKKRNNWQQGIATAHYSEDFEALTPVPIEHGRMVLDGALLEARDRTDEIAASVPWHGFRKEAV